MKKIIILSGFSLLISACTQSIPAEISDVSNSTSSSGTVLSSYIAPPKNISSGKQLVSTDSSSSDASSSDSAPLESGESQQTTSDDDNESNVITTQEQIVYKRNYDDIPKGGYQGSSYTVKRGDTLFYIAWVTGNDYRALAAKNKIQEPYALQEGQVLNVGGSQTVVVTEKKTTLAEINKENSVIPAPTPISPPQTSPAEQATPMASSTAANVSWRWPARGRIIEKFSKATKGIDIAGSLGDRISSAADGRVVYAGNALPGYGNLIIIKHNDDYLTAYAHNQKMLVKEQQIVKAGQQIATMGATGTASVRLHFEIRYRAQSVDPLKYLPSR